MAEIWGAALVAAGTAYAANEQAGAAKDAAAASQNAANASTAEQRRQFDLTRQDQMPWLDAGRNALSQIAELNAGDFSSFRESPDYQFALTQGLQGLDRSAAARGGLLAGGHSADVMEYASGLASQNYNNYKNGLYSIAGLGQTTASGLGSLGMGMANSIGNLNMANADAQRQSAYAKADANSQLAGGLAGLATGINWGGGQTTPDTSFASGFGNNTGWLSGGLTPQTGGWQSGGYAGSLGPSNGSNWNFGG